MRVKHYRRVGAEWHSQPVPTDSDCRCGHGDGERLEFGRHRLTAQDAETAEAWPSMGAWSGRRNAALTRRLRRLSA